jgi:protein-L-isoaspartate(D-aspartate) O-methyltransferase
MSDVMSTTAARAALAGRLRASEAVADAFHLVPRHAFLSGFDVAEAYLDTAVVVRSDADGLPVSAATQPAMMAVMLDQLGLARGQRVLEIGTGTGYNAALLACLVGDQRLVVTVEAHAGLAEGAQAALAAAGYGGITVRTGDGALGAPDHAPFDRIIATAGIWDIPPAWLAQLTDEGRMVLPLAIRGIQVSVALERASDHWVSRSARRCGFIRGAGALAGPESVLALGPQPGLHAYAVDGPAPDPIALYRALSAEPVEVVTGLQAADVPELADLDLWLTLTEPGLGRLSLFGRHEGRAGPAQRRIADLLPLGALISATDTGPLGVATLSPDGGWQAGSSGILVRGYGPAGPQLAEYLACQATGWHEQGRPGTRELRLAVHPGGQQLVPQAGEIIVDRPHARLALGWEPAARTVSPR